VPRSKESITSFRDRFSGASSADNIFNELTKNQELKKFITKLRVGNQKQLKLLRIKAECIEDVFDVIGTFETSHGIEQRHGLVNFNKTYKNRFSKQNKKRFNKEERISPGRQSRAEVKQGSFQGSTHQ